VTLTETKFLPFKNVFNPIRESLVIKYSLEGNAKDDVKLLVYSRSGSEIADLDRGAVASNGYQTTWDGRSKGTIVSSGAYMLVLKANGKVVKTKIVVVK
jgi:flagellar hook assembly protein FlgD